MVSLKGLLVSHPIKAAFLVVIIVVALAASVYAYFKLLPSQSGPKVSITSPPLEFSIELNKAEYQFGENITITFNLRNIGNQTVTVTKLTEDSIDPFYQILFTDAEGASTDHPNPNMISYLFHFGYSILDINGTKVYERIGDGIAALYDIVLEPNGYVKQTYIWYREYHFQFLPRGTYQIRGIFNHFTTQGITLETPSIAFIIR
jgi:hypothetical protein